MSVEFIICQELTSCVADAHHDRIWSISFSTGTIYSFFVVAGFSRADEAVGLLAFDHVETKAQRKFVGGNFDITR
jgi:hypothetical protein